MKNIIIDLDEYFDISGDYKKKFKQRKKLCNVIITRSKTTPLIIGSCFLSCWKIEKLRIDNVYNVIGIRDNFLKSTNLMEDCDFY